MNYQQKTKIEFYRQRTFSEKLNVTFDFIRENWKPLLKYTFYIIMPICLIQAFFLNTFLRGYVSLMNNQDNAYSQSASGIMLNYGIIILCVMVGSSLMSGLIYAMMQTYNSRENRLQDLMLSDFKDALVRNAWRSIKIAFVMTLLAAVFIGVIVLLAVSVSTVSLAITIPLFLVFCLCLIPLMMIIPAYLFERDITLFKAIKKAWKLGITTLGGMLGLIIVLGIIASVIQTVVMLPWYIMSMIGFIFSMDSSSTVMTNSVIFKFVQYIFGLIMSYGIYASSIISIVGLAFQYFHAREKVEGVTIKSNIENFDKLN